MSFAQATYRKETTCLSESGFTAVVLPRVVPVILATICLTSWKKL